MIFISFIRLIPCPIIIMTSATNKSSHRVPHEPGLAPSYYHCVYSPSETVHPYYSMVDKKVPVSPRPYYLNYAMPVDPES